MKTLNESQIGIYYKNDIPEEIINEFKRNIERENLVLISEKEKDEYYSLIGPEINDIIIFISQHKTELLVTGFIVTAVYDIIKSSVIGLFKSIKARIFKEKSKDKNITIRLNLTQEHQLDFELNTNLKDEQIDIVIESSFEFIKKKNHIEYVQNPDYITEQDGFKSTKFTFEPDKKLWLPINYGKMRKDLENFQNEANESFLD